MCRHYVTNEFEISTACRFRVNSSHGRDRRTDKHVQPFRPDTTVLYNITPAARRSSYTMPLLARFTLWPIAAKIAAYNFISFHSFADNNVCTFWPHLKAFTQMWKMFCISNKPSSTKRRTPTTCDLQPSLSGLFKRYHKNLAPFNGKISATTSNFLSIMQ